MDVWSSLTSDQRLTVCIAVGSAILGGTISMATSWVLARQVNKHALKMREVEKLESGAFLAQRGFVKLLQFGNSVYSLKGTIDEQFDCASEEGDEDLLPVQKVQEINGMDTEFEVFFTEELAFLLHGEDAELLGDLLIFEKRIISSNQAIAHYNDKRAELTDMLEKGAIAVRGTAGTTLSSELEGREALLVDVRVGALQGLLGIIMERLEREVKQSRSLMNRFNVAAKREYGDLYPNLKFEDPKKC